MKARRVGIDAPHEAIAYMHHECPACKSEGFRSIGRVLLRHDGRDVIAALHVVDSIVSPDEVGLSEAAWRRLAPVEGADIEVAHVPVVLSARHLRAKMYGHKLDDEGFEAIIQDITHHLYSTAQLAAFVTACTGNGLDVAETRALTKAMVGAGQRITWPAGVVADKHCVGGLPGNRTTPIVVAICASAGVRIPKTSSRAITSPAGTADTMATLTNVDLRLADIQAIVAKEGGCFAWGGAVDLSPADDTLIRVERALDVDSPGQVVASVLSKKAAAGSTHVLIDIPIGPTAKVRDEDAAVALQALFEAVAETIGLKLRCVRTDGSQPVGRGIGPALEAMDVLAVLRRTKGAPLDLRDRSLMLAGATLELAGVAPSGTGKAMATKILDSGAAWSKFQAICLAQGGLREPPLAAHRSTIESNVTGKVVDIDNRRLAEVAKLAGAPDEPAAGILMHVRLGDEVRQGSTLFEVHAESPGALQYALEHLANSGNPVILKPR